jgi:hypothetical protein
MALVPTFEIATLEAICSVLGDTSTGLTGSEIGTVLRQCGIDDPQPGTTKRHRLFEALRLRRERDRVGNHVVAAIQAALSNIASALCSLPVADNQRAATASTKSRTEAQASAAAASFCSP